MITWIDLESTGLDCEKGSILEIAIVVTDDNLEEVGEPFTSIMAPLPSLGYAAMDDFVKEMHTKNGLLAEIYEGHPSDQVLRSGLLRVWDIETAAVEFVVAGRALQRGEAEFDREAAIKELRGTPLGGSSVHFDRTWLHRHMPSLEKLFSHRHLDVSSYNEGAKRWWPEIHARRPGLGPDGKPLPQHRALEDIRASIETAKFYRRELSRP